MVGWFWQKVTTLVGWFWQKVTILVGWFWQNFFNAESSLKRFLQGLGSGRKRETILNTALSPPE